MDNYKLICHKCGKEYALGNYSLCPECGGILTLEYTDEYLKEVLKEDRVHQSMWDYHQLLPPVKEENSERISFSYLSHSASISSAMPSGTFVFAGSILTRSKRWLCIK